MALAIKGRAIVAKFTVAVSRDLKLAFKVVDPSADKRGCIGRKVSLKNLYFIQFYLVSKIVVLGERLKVF